MTDILEILKNKAVKKQKTIVLPEGNDQRVQAAAKQIAQEKIAKVIMLADQDVNIPDVTTINLKKYSKINELAEHLYKRRQAKGMQLAEALDLVTNSPEYAGAAMVGLGLADGMVCGCITETAKVIKSAVYCVGTKPGIKLISSFFMMVSPYPEFGDNGVVFFADCGVNPNPTAEQLVDITKCTADSYLSLIDNEPRIAMLSFSTKGSAVHPDVDKVIQALNLTKAAYPDLKVDGEFQVDAAVVPAVGQRKAPGSPIAGKANVLIFPDLDAGNIGYKLVQRFGKALAFGPVLQGVAKPVNDLSRGATTEDIVNVAIITVLQV